MNSLKLENLSPLLESLPKAANQPTSSKAETPTEIGESFVDLLKESLDQVNELQGEADSAIKGLVAGRSKNVHETMLAIEKADLSLKLMMQVRNKMLDAYREIMRMQV